VSLEFFEDVFIPPALLREDMVWVPPVPPALDGHFHCHEVLGNPPGVLP
jgi:hypothetical protein